MQYTQRGRALLWGKPNEFAETHCRNCKAGWTRTSATGEEGREREEPRSLTVCLLDREPILAAMTACDRYEPRAATPPKA
jgi:hypothetical protein